MTEPGAEDVTPPTTRLTLLDLMAVVMAFGLMAGLFAPLAHRRIQFSDATAYVFLSAILVPPVVIVARALASRGRYALQPGEKSSLFPFGGLLLVILGPISGSWLILLFVVGWAWMVFQLLAGAYSIVALAKNRRRLGWLGIYGCVLNIVMAGYVTTWVGGMFIRW